MHTLRTLLAAGVLAFTGPLSGGLEFTHTRLERSAEPGDTQMAVVFPFRNSGDAPVAVLGVESSCDCTTAHPVKAAYAPGEAGEIPLLFRFGDREGVHTKLLTVRTDELGHPGYRLALQVEIPVAAEVKPRLLFWRGAGPDQTREVTITNRTEGALKLVNLDEPSGAFSVDSRPLPAAGGHVLTLKPLRRDQELRSELTLTLETASGRRLSYRVYLRSLPEPSAVDPGQDAGDAKAGRPS